jgi:hypothetical protein
MSSLLSRMEQQFEVMNTRVMNDSSMSDHAATKKTPAPKIRVIRGQVRTNNRPNGSECDEM